MLDKSLVGNFLRGIVSLLSLRKQLFHYSLRKLRCPHGEIALWLKYEINFFWNCLSRKINCCKENVCVFFVFLKLENIFSPDFLLKSFRCPGRPWHCRPLRITTDCSWQPAPGICLAETLVLNAPIHRSEDMPLSNKTVTFEIIGDLTFTSWKHWLAFNYRAEITSESTQRQ